MALMHKTYEYMSEPIVKLIVYHVVLIIAAAVVILYSEYHAGRYFEKPARENILNQNNKGKLAHIIKRELLLFDAKYRTMLFSRNKKHILNISKKLKMHLEHSAAILPILQNGGKIKDFQSVNFYDKDEVVEEIHYRKAVGNEISVDVINLGPKLAELKKFANMTTLLLLREVSGKGGINQNARDELFITMKQAEALLLRLIEDSNKIYYDIQQENIKYEKQINDTHRIVNCIVLFINVGSNLIVVIVAILIALKIFQILKKQKIIEDKNKKTNESLNTIIDNIPVGVVLINTDKEIVQINETASKILKHENLIQANQKLLGCKCNDCFCDTDASKCPVLDLGKPRVLFTEEKLLQKDDTEEERITILKSVIPVTLNEQYLLMEVFIDISERKRHERDLERETERANEMAQKSIIAEEMLKRYNENLENMVENRTCELQQVIVDLKSAQTKLLHSEKLASIGQLAAGIAHEINTPIQYVGDNTRFLGESFGILLKLLKAFESQFDAVKTEIADYELGKAMQAAVEEADLDYLEDEVPLAIAQTMNGVERVSEIVRSMKEFSHPGVMEKTAVDLNRAIENTVMVSRNEWKYVAKIETDLDASLPLVPCLPGELNQVFLNMIINAAQAIGDVVGDGSNGKGRIRISTRKMADDVEIRINDNGPGIPENIQTRIYDPFFTTKEVGKGTGQGLAISRSVIEEKHGGDLRLETEAGHGATFVIRLPMEREAA